MLLKRAIEDEVLKYLRPNKVVVLLGPRRVGKTVLIQQILNRISEPYLLLHGEDQDVRRQLEYRSTQRYKNIIGGKSLLIIDEAQKIPEIGNVLKLMVDTIAGIKILATGSSSFDLEKFTGEPLTGRKHTFYLFGLSEKELNQTENIFEKEANLRNRLVYGNYPELIHLEDLQERKAYLDELIKSYLLKDILEFDLIRNSEKILQLLRLIAYQIGGEVSFTELGKQLGISKNTVERYLDLLSKVYIIHSVGAWSRNLRKEIVKGKKWYFFDNGIRNALIGDMKPIENRNDVGLLWENYIISERIKYQQYEKMLVYNYFWRTYDQQEIDWIEDREGKLHAYEFKWNPRKKAKLPNIFKATYPKSEFELINRENFLEWVS
ncbi:ATP-binding protein [Phaeodactylibacter xiamenensis]|uniref:ATP-binding protein n=1 Tax=Phaeodactylibacter xiamenensis TaxID=1524460 RepID=UPI0024A83833|nr:ATP-binding protein [Phaeodactylibacter xiamenensis]